MKTLFSRFVLKHRRTLVALPVAAMAFLMVGGSSCRRKEGGEEGGGTGPIKAVNLSPQTYAQVVSAFYTGVIALETGPENVALERLTQASKLAPQEPAIWGNLILYHLRYPGKDPVGAQTAAVEAWKKARELAPQNAKIEAYHALLEGQQGKNAEVLAGLRRASELDPKDGRIALALISELERQSSPENDAEILRRWQQVRTIAPENRFALVQTLQSAAHNNNAEIVKECFAKIKARAQEWSADIRGRLPQLEQATSSADIRSVEPLAVVLHNVLKRNFSYGADVDALRVEAKKVLDSMDKFLALPAPSATPSPEDTGLTLTEQPAPGATTSKGTRVLSLSLLPEMNNEVASGFISQKEKQVRAQPEAPQTLIVADGQKVQGIPAPNSATKPFTLPFPGGAKQTPPSADGIAVFDFDFDFRQDFALAGEGGLRLFRQTPQSEFTDVTAKMGLPASVTGAAYYGVWPADIESDGDLDLIVAPLEGAPSVLRNNGNGTWTPISPFTGVKSVRACVWADLDGDDLADVAMLDAQGSLHLFRNERSGRFTPWEGPKDTGKLTAISAADVTRNGVFDLTALKADGSIVRIAHKPEGGWETTELTKWAEAAGDSTARLLWADLDNNGGTDLIGSGKAGGKVWLCDAKGSFVPLAAPVTARNLRVTETNATGRLDLVGVNATGQPVLLTNKGTKNYHWHVIRPRANFVERKEDRLRGDQRINSFSYGGEVEIRAGLLYQAQPITGPSVHFGLGDYPQADYARVIYPNGSWQGEFGPDIEKIPEKYAVRNEQMLIAKQRLNGSCPWLFAWNGTEMKLVTDCIWRSPLGLKINAQDTAGVAQTEDWVKIRADQLVPHDGYYDLRIAAELWETHFFDHLALMTVDHPAGTDIFIDERFAIPPPPLAIIATTTPQPIARVTDDNGTDVTEIVRTRDEQYLDTFGRGDYQGVTRDHYVEVVLPEAAPRRGTLYLIATGWIHPTDSSVNVALAQAGIRPQGLSLEIPDGKGGWKVAKPGLGFPEGKIKTVVLNLTGLFSAQEKGERKLRLRTNLEIFWDVIGWSAGKAEVQLKTQRLLPNVANLHFRGFSATHQANASSPELPDYNKVVHIGQQWLDLEGYHTRFGDVLPLLTKTDDRYVMMNAGDEMALRFPVPPPPPAGWVRDFVLIGDGWVKDGNFNTTYSKTVGPLPLHAKANYPTPPGSLEEEAAYRKHPEDWQTYHTRYVRPRYLQRGLIPSAPP